MVGRAKEDNKVDRRTLEEAVVIAEEMCRRAKS